MKARVKVQGLASIDQRTVAARALLSWRRSLIDDLGGLAAVTAAQLALVEMATRTKLYVDHVDAFLLEQPSLILRTAPAQGPAPPAGAGAAAARRRSCEGPRAVGSGAPRPKPPDLSEFLARYGNKDGEGSVPTNTPDPSPAPADEGPAEVDA